MKPTLASTLAVLLALATPFVHADDAPRCRYTMIGKLPLRYTGPNLSITTEGVINGTPAVMLIDTASNSTVLTRTGTERRGMKLSNTGRVTQGIGGYSSLYQTRVDEFRFGPVRSPKGYLNVVTDFGMAPSYDATIGASFLLQTDLEIAMASREIRFFQAQDCGDAFLAYWDADAQAVPFESYSGGSSNPRFTVFLNGEKMVAEINTGTQVSVVFLEAAKRIGMLPDTPGVVRAAGAVGVGKRTASRWHAVFKTFQIGEETIRNAGLNIIDGKAYVDVILGADFLRAHRVLFAMSQRKLYFSYAGGQPFDRPDRLEPWIEAEANAGNADAQMALVGYHARGAGVPRDPATANAWVEKAAANGNPQALLRTGRALTRSGQPAEGALRLRAALDKLPSDRYAALWLYLARIANGQAELGRTELAGAFARGGADAWPAPIADFYLGKLSAADLLKQGSADGGAGKARACGARAAIAGLHEARGEREQAQAARALEAAECGKGAENGEG